MDLPKLLPSHFKPDSPTTPVQVEGECAESTTNAWQTINVSIYPSPTTTKLGLTVRPYYERDEYDDEKDEGVIVTEVMNHGLCR